MEKKDIARIFVTQCKENKMYQSPDGKGFISQNLCECYCKDSGQKVVDIVELNKADYATEIAEIENPVAVETTGLKDLAEKVTDIVVSAIHDTTVAPVVETSPVVAKK